MANTFSADPVWVKSKNHASAENGVGDADPLSRADVINRPAKSLAAVLKRLTALLDGATINLQDQSGSVLAGAAVQDVCWLTNRTATTLALGDVVTIDTANDASVVLGDTVGSQKIFVVSLGALNNAVAGPFAFASVCTVKNQGAVTRGHYLKKSATSKAVEDTGVVMGGSLAPPTGAIGVALASAGGSGTVLAWLFGAPFVTTAPPTLQKATVRLNADFSTTSTTFVDVTSATITFTTTARRVLLTFSGWMANTLADPAYPVLTFNIDAADVGTGAAGLVICQTTGYPQPCRMIYLTDVLTAASHTFKVRMKCSGASSTATLWAATLNAQFSAVEIY